MKNDWMYLYAYDRRRSQLHGPACWSKHRTAAALVSQLYRYVKEGLDVRVWIGATPMPSAAVEEVIKSCDPITRFIEARRDITEAATV